MADDSPGKVQALRAIFAEKNTPVMGMLPPHRKITNYSRRTSEHNSNVLPMPKTTSADHNDNKDLDETCKIAVKPPVGPKPSHLVQKTLSSEKVHNDKSHNRTSDGNNQTAKSCQMEAFGDTIASFMFNASNKDNSESHATEKPRTSLVDKQVEKENLSQALTPSRPENCNIDFDNYICKSSCRVRRKELPSLKELGPAPPKPNRPPLQPSSQNFASSKTVSSLQTQSIPTKFKIPPIPQRPSYPCPLRPQTPPPLPPDKKYSFRQEIEELYEDTIEEGGKRRPICIMPDDDELFYADTDINNLTSSEYRTEHSSSEELYQDASDFKTEEFYEVMPCDGIQEDFGSALYGNNKKEVEKVKRDDEKRLRQEQKEKEKKDKVMEKLKKKFGITGDEIPIDDGLVKCDSRGGRGDLSVKRGETVLILRMEGNPSGRWLVKNEKGKIGYVELTNIEVDPISVKSVMSVRGMSGVDGEELYCEAKSKEVFCEMEVNGSALLR